MLSQEFIDEMKTKLEEAKAKFAEDLSGLSKHTEVGDEPDENATEVAMDEVNQNLIKRLEEDLKMIDKALAKIEDGSYGTDDEGKNISEDRLRAMPWADTAL